MLIRFLLSAALVFVAAGSRADESELIQKDAPETLGAPRELMPDAVPLLSEVANPAYLRTSRYDVWQYYGVDRFGRFRPRVIHSPYGSYYLYNGEPYPWASTHQLDLMPYVVD